MGSRDILPPRRDQIVHHVTFRLAGDPTGIERTMAVAGGFVAAPFPQGGIVREIFVDAGYKVGSQAEFELNDQAVMASLLLQLGMTPRGLRLHLGGGEKGMGVGADGKGIGPCTSVIQRALEELIDIQIAVDRLWGAKAERGSAAE